MSFAASLVVGLAAAALAKPITAPIQLDSIPPTSTSKGFRLIVNVTDPSKDFTPSINGKELLAYHELAALSRATAEGDALQGDIFYQYGTADDQANNLSMLLTDLGINVAGLQLGAPAAGSARRSAITDQSILYDSTVNFGFGDVGVMVNADLPLAYVVAYQKTGSPSTFVVCNETIDNLSQGPDDRFLTVDWLWASTGASDVPAGCAPVNLVPECDVLTDVAGEDPKYHAGANEVRCYQNVSAINWS